MTTVMFRAACLCISALALGAAAQADSWRGRSGTYESPSACWSAGNNICYAQRLMTASAGDAAANMNRKHRFYELPSAGAEANACLSKGGGVSQLPCAPGSMAVVVN